MPVHSGICVELIDHSFHIPKVIIYCSGVLGRIPTRRDNGISGRAGGSSSAEEARDFCKHGVFLSFRLESETDPIIVGGTRRDDWSGGRCLRGGTSVIGRIGPLSPRAHTSRRRTAGTNRLTSPGDLQSSHLISGLVFCLPSGTRGQREDDKKGSESGEWETIVAGKWMYAAAPVFKSRGTEVERW